MRVMKGCFSASTGVHLFSGFKFKHRSNKSTNRFNSFVSTSSIVPFALASNLVLRSRVGLVKLRMRMTSYISRTVSAVKTKFNEALDRSRANNEPFRTIDPSPHFESLADHQSEGSRIEPDGESYG